MPERTHIHLKQDKDGDDAILPMIDLTNNPFDIDDDIVMEKGEMENTEGEKSDTGTMNGPTLQEMPLIETVEDEEEDPKPSTGDATNFDADFLKMDSPTQPGLPPEEMVDRTFLMPPTEDGSRVRAKIIEHINQHKDRLASHPEVMHFKCLINDDYQEVVAHNDIVDFIKQDDSWDGTWKFKKILDHKGPTKPSEKDYKGAQCNLQVLWETGEISWEPLTRQDKQGVHDTDPVTVAIYVDKHKLLDTPGWKLAGLKKHAKTQKHLLWCANQAKSHSFRTKPVCMCGFLAPWNHEQAMELDKASGNTKW